MLTTVEICSETLCYASAISKQQILWIQNIFKWIKNQWRFYLTKNWCTFLGCNFSNFEVLLFNIYNNAFIYTSKYIIFAKHIASDKFTTTKLDLKISSYILNYLPKLHNISSNALQINHIFRLCVTQQGVLKDIQRMLSDTCNLSVPIWQCFPYQP